MCWYVTAAEEVQCVTRAATGVFNADIVIQTADDRRVSSTCGDTCTYTFSSDDTPTVTSISPDSVTTNDQTLTFTGARQASCNCAK